MKKKKIAIIGGGITSLVTAFCLGNKYSVTIYEEAKTPGGMLQTIQKKGWKWPLELFYHHLFTTDTEAIQLIRTLGLGDKLLTKRPLSKSYYQGKYYQLDSFQALLAFTPITFGARVWFGIGVALCKIAPYVRTYNSLSALTFSKLLFGPSATSVIWEPLMRAKFGHYTKAVSFSWLWARINKRTPRLIYMTGSFHTLVATLVNKLTRSGTKMLLGQRVTSITRSKNSLRVGTNISKSGPFDAILVTTPYPKASQLINQKTPKIAYLGAAVLILELKEPFFKDHTYWLNIHDRDYPFLVVVEQTNLVSRDHYGGSTILYIGGYYPHKHKALQDKNYLLQNSLPYLTKLNPEFSTRAILSTHYHAIQYAQPIVKTGYSAIRPELQTHTKGLYWANLSHIFPWDRGVNFSVAMGKKAAKILDSYLTNHQT